MSMGVLLENPSDYPVLVVVKSRLVDEDGAPISVGKAWRRTGILVLPPHSTVGTGYDVSTNIEDADLERAVDVESMVESEEWYTPDDGTAESVGLASGELSTSNVDHDPVGGARGQDRLTFDVHSTFTSAIDSSYVTILVRDPDTEDIVGGYQLRAGEHGNDLLHTEFSCPPGDSEVQVDFPYYGDIKGQDIEVYVSPDPYPVAS